MSARSWWVMCMASRLDECRATFGAWKAQAARAGLPDQLQPLHTHTAVSLAEFEPMARCVVQYGERIGVDPNAMLTSIEMASEQQSAGAAWARAVGEVEPLRAELQQSFLRKGDQQRRAGASLARRMFAGGSDEVELAPTAEQMGADEVLMCQVWMYGVGSRLQACQRSSRAFAAAAGLRDPNHPLENYDQKRWDPRSPVWREMEACVHVHAAKAGARADDAWRRRVGGAPR
jgi:hypothetical protein